MKNIKRLTWNAKDKVRDRKDIKFCKFCKSMKNRFVILTGVVGAASLVPERMCCGPNQRQGQTKFRKRMGLDFNDWHDMSRGTIPAVTVSRWVLTHGNKKKVHFFSLLINMLVWCLIACDISTWLSVDLSFGSNLGEACKHGTASSLASFRWCKR